MLYILVYHNIVIEHFSLIQDGRPCTVLRYSFFIYYIYESTLHSLDFIATLMSYGRIHFLAHNDDYYFV